jgi:hypothetical protein
MTCRMMGIEAVWPGTMDEAEKPFKLSIHSCYIAAPRYASSHDCNVNYTPFNIPNASPEGP